MLLTVGFFVPHLKHGGIERVILNILLRLDRERFRPVLILRVRHGALLAHVPDDVQIVDLGGRPMRRARRALARVLAATGVDVLYSGTNAANLAALASRPLLARPIPMVASEHTAPDIYLDEAKWRALRVAAMRRLYPRAARISVPLQAVGDELCALLALPDLPIVELPNPVFDKSALRNGADAPPEWPAGAGPVYVAVGRLVPAKGFDVLLRAFAQLPVPEDAPPRLVVCGEGPEHGPLDTLSRELGLATRVRMFGTTVENPFAFYRRATAVVSASRREGFGNVLVEAMACGTPVVATDCPVGPRRLVGDDEAAGLLVAPDDVDALAHAMRRVAADPSIAARSAQAGPQRAQPYEAAHAIRAFETLFASMAGA